MIIKRIETMSTLFSVFEIEFHSMEKMQRYVVDNSTLKTKVLFRRTPRNL